MLKQFTKSFFVACLMIVSVSGSYLNASIYQKPAAIAEERWNNIQGFLLPEDHPVKTKLDKLFKDKRPTETYKTLEKAKFHFMKNWWADMVVAKHPKIKGYVLKIYTDDILWIDELENFVTRIYGALFVQNLIDAHGYQAIFKVPKKWLYPLQDIAEAPGLQRKNFILVAEDLNLAHPQANKLHWKDSTITKETLLALFTMLKAGGLNDSVYVHNIPFNMEGKICFIDTENYLLWPVAYDKLTSSFSKSNRKFWTSLIESSK